MQQLRYEMRFREIILALWACDFFLKWCPLKSSFTCTETLDHLELDGIWHHFIIYMQ